MQAPEILVLIKLLSKLPGLGPRSGRRAALHLMKNRPNILLPLIEALQEAEKKLCSCSICYNLDTSNPCGLCQDPRRDHTTLCVVEEIADLWALERTGTFKGTYHVLGGTLSALQGKGPEDLQVQPLLERVKYGENYEVILALGATVEGQATIHYLLEKLQHTNPNLKITSIAHGVPLGGELDYLDDGTIATALKARRGISFL